MTTVNVTLTIEHEAGEDSSVHEVELEVEISGPEPDVGWGGAMEGWNILSCDPPFPGSKEELEAAVSAREERITDLAFIAYDDSSWGDYD